MQDDSEAEPATPTLTSLKRRLFWLLFSATLGLGVGFAGHHFTDNPAWFLALPIAVAVGWMFFADPIKCLDSKGCHKDYEA